MILSTPALSVDRMADVRRRAIFECCKWDPQVEDTSVLADYALLLDESQWDELRKQAETLYQETVECENEVLAKPELLDRLGLPRKLANVLKTHAPGCIDAGNQVFRVMRFDFHPCEDGWRVSEVNSDVPGGFVETSGIGAIMREEFAGMGIDCRMAGDPSSMIIEQLRMRFPQGGRVGLVHATAYTDDRQVMIFLQRILEKSNFSAVLASPADVQWRENIAYIGPDKLDVVFRFFPAEWLPNLEGQAWTNFFSSQSQKGGGTLLVNPGHAVISQTKRFPLVWGSLGRGVPLVWSYLQPETTALRGEGMFALRRMLFPPALPDPEEWVLKPALGRVGDGIGLSDTTSMKDWASIRKACNKSPREWVAQRRFKPLAITTPHGPAFPCLGVYVIGGRAAGIYGRIARTPLINHLAQDVAVLVLRKKQGIF